MFTFSNSTVTFTYQLADLRQLLQQYSAQLSLTLPVSTPELSATDAYAVTDDETTLANQLLRDSATTAADEFEKIGQYATTDEALTFSATSPDSFSTTAPKADLHLQDWLVWHTLTRWLRLRHLDQDANQALMQASFHFAALHRVLFPLRN